MAFHDIEKTGAGMPRLVNTVLARIPGNGKAVQIGLSDDVFKKIGNPIALKVMIGTGEHSGFAAFIPKQAVTGNARKVHAKHRVVTVTSKAMGIVQGHQKTVHLPFEITEDGLIVDIRPLRAPALSVAA